MSTEMLVGLASAIVPLFWWMLGRMREKLEQFITFQNKEIVKEQVHLRESVDQVARRLDITNGKVAAATSKNAEQDRQLAWILGRMDKPLESIDDGR